MNAKGGNSSRDELVDITFSTLWTSPIQKGNNFKARGDVSKTDDYGVSQRRITSGPPLHLQHNEICLLTRFLFVLKRRTLTYHISCLHLASAALRSRNCVECYLQCQDGTPNTTRRIIHTWGISIASALPSAVACMELHLACEGRRMVGKAYLLRLSADGR